MKPAPQREENLFQAAGQLTGAERDLFLDGECFGDAALRERLEALLAAHDATDSFMAAPTGENDPALGVRCLTAQDEAVGQTIGRYKLLEKIGEGGCGIVYVAEQEESIRRRVALKVIKLGMDTKQVVARFEVERQALAMMDHPNIAKVLDAGATENGRPYFVMELVRGVRITEYCDQSQLSTRERLDLFIKVCQAIQHAHQKGIIHRDIKPSNILVTLHDNAPAPKVIDFGIAKATAGRLSEGTVYTQLDQFIGTPAYMSPEQAEMSGLDIDTRSDIYSLGVLLYELLTGKTPFDGQELVASGLDAMRRTIREQEPLRPSTRFGNLQGEERTTTARHRGAQALKLMNLLKGDLDWIVMKCLEKDRTRRYETTNGLAMDLKRHLNNEAIVARPPSGIYRFRKLVRRNKLTFAAGMSVAAAVMVGLVVAFWQAVRAEAGERNARHLHYIADMNLAQQTSEQNNMARLRTLLEETRLYPGRSFEWYFWQLQVHSEQRTLRGHLGKLSSAAYSRDGRRIVTAGEDQIVKVWDAVAGTELLALYPHAVPVSCAAFSPDGQRIVTASWDSTAKVWDVTNGQLIATLRGHRLRIMSASFSPDGQRIVTGSWDRSARVWDSATGKQLLILQGHTGTVFPSVFSPDGRRIVTASHDYTAKIWDASDGKQLRTLEGHGAVLFGAAFSPDGQRIATAGGDQTARIWDVNTGKELVVLKGHSAGVLAVDFSPDGAWVVTGSSDQTAAIWDAVTGERFRILKGHTGTLRSVAFSADGQQILTGSEDGTAKLWHATRSGGLRHLSGHQDRILSADFSSNGQRIVTGSSDQTARIWDPVAGRELHRLAGHNGPVHGVAFSPNGQRVATASADGTLRIWECATGRHQLTLTGHLGTVRAVAWSPDSQRVVTASEDRSARVWDLGSSRETLLIAGHTAPLTGVAWSPDGQRIVTASEDYSARVWDAQSGRELFILRGHGELVTAVAFTPDGQWIGTASEDHTAKLWRADRGDLVRTLSGHTGPVVSIAFSADSQRLFTGSHDRTAKLWEVSSGRELLTLHSPGSPVLSVACSPTGRQLFTGVWNPIGRIWESASPEQVEGWREEEQAALQHRVVLEPARRTALQQHRQQGADETGIRQWLVLGPIPLPIGQSGAEAVGVPQIRAEGELRPRVGDKVVVGGREFVWQAVELASASIDFQNLFGSGTPQCVVYAVSYLHSPREQGRVRIRVGSDDQAKLYLNGREIYQSRSIRAYVPDQDAVSDLKLRAGVNSLVFKVVNDRDQWQGSIRCADEEGRKLPGLAVRLTPE